MTEPKKEHISWRDVYRLDDETIINNDLPYDKWPKQTQQFFDDMMKIYEKTDAGQEWLQKLQEKHGQINVVGTMTYMVGDRKIPTTGLGVPRSGRDMVVVMQNFEKFYVRGQFNSERFRGIPVEQLATREMRLKLGAAMVGHEVGHHLNQPDDLARKMGKKFMDGVACGEKVAVDTFEDRIRAELGLPLRKTYIDANQQLLAGVKYFKEHISEFEFSTEDFEYLKRRFEGKPIQPEYEPEYNREMADLVSKMRGGAEKMVKQNVFACTTVSPEELGRSANNLLLSFVNEQIAKADKAPKDAATQRQ
ncbi:MAG: hypothetical protein MRY32_04665 [Rickettsiales bacterium]|nr:hypothetical protein [Rickettsiales bacterium]